MIEPSGFWEQYSAGLITIGVAVLIGVAIDFVIYQVLSARGRTKHWRVGMAVVRALAGLPTFAALLIGVYLAVLRTPMDPAVTATALRWNLVGGILIFTAFSARISGSAVRAYMSREGAKLPSSSIFVNLTRMLVWALGGLSVLAALDVSIAPLLTALGVGGLAVGLALQPTLENVFAGIQVLLSKQVEPGDFIQLESGQQGHVIDVTWRNTTVKLLSNDVVIVPNSVLGKSVITNFTSADQEHVLWVPFGVSYASDLDAVERVTLEVAAQVQREVVGAVRDHEPAFRCTAFGESSIDCQVSLRADSPEDRFVLRHEAIKRLHRRLAEESIEIPFPQRVVHSAAAD